VTLPPPSITPAPPISPLPPPAVLAPVRFPLSWILEHAAAPIRYRAMTDVARLPSQSADRLSFLPFTHRPALMLAMLQASDGTWNRSMLSVPSTRAEHFEGVGTISAVRRLLEYGWDKDTPPLLLARRVLFRLLAEDEDPEWLFEIKWDGMRALAWIAEQRQFADEFLLIPTTELVGVAVEGGAHLFLNFHPHSQERTRLDPYRRALSDLGQLAEDFCRSH